MTCGKTLVDKSSVNKIAAEIFTIFILIFEREVVLSAVFSHRVESQAQ